jgi:hypothetical protein
MTAGAAFALLVAAANGEAASLEPGPQMCVARMNHYSLQMPDGRVALLGGHGTGFVSLDSMDLWSPTNNEFACVGLPFVYDSGALVRMADGRYLMAGGAADLGVAPGYASAQILDPASATVTTTGTTMVRPRMMCAGTQLTGGKVLIVGGWYDQDSATYGEIFDPANNAFSATGPLNTPRSMPWVYPTADGKAVVVGGMDAYGASLISSIELYDPTANTFTNLAPSAITGETDWVYYNSEDSQDPGQSKTGDGRYVFMMSRTVNSQTEYALGLFDPATEQFSKLALTPAFWNGFGVWPPVVDAANNRVLLLVGANQNGGANLTFQVFQADLATGQALSLSDWLSVTNYYPGSAGITLLRDGRLFVTGGASSLGYSYNFSPVQNTFFLSGLTPPPVIQPVTQTNRIISLTWSTVVAYLYQVQYSTNLTSTNWFNLGNPITATNGTASTSDRSGANPQRFYRVVASP